LPLPLRPWTRLRSLGVSAAGLPGARPVGQCVRAPLLSCAPPRRSWKTAAVAVQTRASLPEVLFPFDARMGSSVCAMVPRPSRDPCFLRLGCQHVTGSLGPPRASCSTCRACFIPAASMGFSLQRSVHIASRTPLGSPCPSVPWPRVAPFGFPSTGCRVSVTVISRRRRRMCGAASRTAGMNRDPSTTRFRDVGHGSGDPR
jgi:hypothetical protein